METATLIIGGGVSGLALAEALEWRGQDFILAEARNRFGGRIVSVSHDGVNFDTGPAWFWNGQPRVAALVERLGLQPFKQYATGAQTYEDQTGHIQRGRGPASMEGAWRLDGGLRALTDALQQRLPPQRKLLNVAAIRMKQSEGKVDVTFATGQSIRAKRVVLAMPPRLAASISFAPQLAPETREAMNAVPTWMAGHAKVIAIYETPFWRDAGLSGDAMSRVGPLSEIHDASPKDRSLGALFGFVGVPTVGRRDVGRLRQNIRTQLARLFGAAAGAPVALHLKDWAYDPFTATAEDAVPLKAHPRYGLPQSMTGLWGNQLILSGTETALQSGGYIEGALEAADTALTTICPSPTRLLRPQKRFA